MSSDERPSSNDETVQYLHASQPLPDHAASRVRYVGDYELIDEIAHGAEWESSIELVK